MNGTDRVPVGVVDDHDLLVAGVRALLSTKHSPAKFVVGARTVDGLLAAQRDIRIVLLDVRLDDGSRAEDNVRRLAAHGLTVLLHADAEHREAIPVFSRTPAKGIVWKNEPARGLLQALATVAEGNSWQSANHAVRPVDLTHRELEVLRLYATGLKYSETAAALDPPVSVESVKTYLSRIRKRYDEAGRPASTRMELRRRALEDGLLPPELTG